MQKRILLVEDEENLHDAIKMNLELESYFGEGEPGNRFVKSFRKISQP